MMGMGGGTYRLGRVLGIPIGIHWSLLAVMLVILLLFTGSFEDITGNQTTAFGYALATALLFYGSILLHELGHAVVARRNNIEITGIDLWMFGGVAKLGRDTDSAGAEFRIAIAGPLVTVAIAAVLIAIAVFGFGVDSLSDFYGFGTAADNSALLALITFLATINVWLLGFNLIPGFPLDGGRIVRAIAWKVTGDRARGTVFAASLGRLFSYIFMGIGLAIVIFGRATPGAFIDGMWLAFIGFIIGDAARAAIEQTAVQTRLEGLRVADVMDAEPVAIPAQTTIGVAMHEYFLRYRYPWFPVVDDAGHYVGVVELERAQRVPEEKQPVFKVNELMRTEGDQYRVRSDDPLEALLSSEPLRRLGALMAVDEDGRLKGIVTVNQISQALQQGAAR